MDQAKEATKIVLAQPRGFCAGVERAVAMVERALEIFGKPIYIRHEIVHNKSVIEDLQNKGAVFVEDIAEIPEGSITIFSAHGISKKVHAEAQAKNLNIFDATCPLVTKVHLEVHKFARDGRECILIGHSNHPEVEGTLGQYSTVNGGKMYLIEDLQQAETIQVANPNHLAYVTQTTLSFDDTEEIVKVLRRRFPAMKEPYKNDICYATQNRQNAVKELVEECQLVIVIGSRNSSNSNRLCELAQKLGRTSYLIDDASELRPEWLDKVSSVGVTAGASAPEKLVVDVVNRLKEWGVAEVTQAAGDKETVYFNLPTNMRRLTAASDSSPADMIATTKSN